MSADRSPLIRRAFATLVLLAALGVAHPVAAASVGRQVDPVPSTDPLPATAPGGPDADGATTLPDEGGADDTTAAPGDGAAFEDAQDRADDDLWAVWTVVISLGIVAAGLLVLLVLYVRATNPERAERRRAALVARSEARRSRADGPADADADADAARPVTPAAPVVAVAPSPGAADDEGEPVRRSSRRSRRRDAAGGPDAALDGDGPAAASPVIATPPSSTRGLSRDPEPSDDEGVTVIAAAAGEPPAALAKAGPAVPDAISPPVEKSPSTKPRPARARAGAKVRAPAPAGPPRGPAAGDETVRIVPAPAARSASGPPPPQVAPAPPGSAAPMVAATVAPPPTDRPPPRSLIDTPPPPRRPRRVDAPAKKLGTPDAERVLVRPGQAPVRVPVMPPRESAPKAVDPPSVADDDGVDEADG